MAVDEQLRLAYNVRDLESAIHAAKREAQTANAKVIQAEDRYRKAVQKAVGHTSLAFDTCVVCIGNRLISHCVYDRRTSWPTCIFCGSPEYGD